MTKELRDRIDNDNVICPTRTIPSEQCGHILSNTTKLATLTYAKSRVFPSIPALSEQFQELAAEQYGVNFHKVDASTVGVSLGEAVYMYLHEYNLFFSLG